MDRDHLIATDNVTRLTGAFWDSLLDYIDESVATRLSLSGGTMLGEMIFVSGQRYNGYGVLVPDPSYTHTGVYTSVVDHVLDSSIHISNTNLVHLQSTPSVPETGNINVTGDVTCDELHANTLYGDASNVTGLPQFSSTAPPAISYTSNAGVSSELSRRDHWHRGVSAVRAGTGVTCTSPYSVTGNHYGDVTIGMDLSGISISGLSIDGTISGYSLVIGSVAGSNPYFFEGPSGSSILRYDPSIGIHWSKPTTPVASIYLQSVSVADAINGYFHINEDIDISRISATRVTPGTLGYTTVEVRRNGTTLVGSLVINYNDDTVVFTDTINNASLSEGDYISFNITTVEDGSPAGYRINVY